MSLYIKFVVG